MLIVGLCLPCFCAAMDRGELNTMLATAAATKSNTYLEARQGIIASNKSNPSLLAKAAVDPHLTWQQRLVARICYERLNRGAEIDVLRRYDWRTHPQYDKNWEKDHVGPTAYLGKFAIPRFTEAGFWYYYIEMQWKRTSEFSIDSAISRINETRTGFSWIGWSASALQNQPENYYRIRCAIEQIDYDPELADPWSIYCYRFLSNFTNPNPPPTPAVAIPSLVKHHEAFFNRTVGGGRSPKEREEYYWGTFEVLMNSANVSHAEMIEEYINSHPRLAILKGKLSAIRSRPALPYQSDPPFRLGQLPVN
ncbi:MAG: hypothetical protein PCFJNLEI_00373 [Verrucomicrobiae bacterium]|nr:hypothetical protein [Verrucomicrobiae bacterium]